MKEALEEYGGTVIAVLTGSTVLGILALLMTRGNPLGDGFYMLLTAVMP